MKIFLLYSNCILTKGHKYCVINDIQMSKSYRFDMKVWNILTAENIKFDSEKHLKFKELINFLLENQLGFFTDSPESFPPLKNIWSSPSVISNSIFHLNPHTVQYFNSFLLQIDNLGCRYLEIRIDDISSTQFKKCLGYLDNVSLNSILFYLDFKTYSSLEQNEKDYFELTTIVKAIVHSSPKTDLDLSRKALFFVETNIKSKKSCGIISERLFVINIKNYFESKSHNSCLNRKISIDGDGEIKNCPSMKESFGNIKDTTLAEAIEKPNFKKYWDINKDKIHVCKDCEFRYICTDCRAYVEDPEDILSKPLKCGYNPYIGEWSEWSTNPLKQKAIDFYGMREMIKETKQK